MGRLGMCVKSPENDFMPGGFQNEVQHPGLDKVLHFILETAAIKIMSGLLRSPFTGRVNLNRLDRLRQHSDA